MVKILDCTTRDGGNSTNWTYSDEYIFDLVNTLNQNKVTFYEIGYRNYYNNENKGAFYHCIPEIIDKFYNLKKNLQIGVMVDAKRFSEIDFPDAKNDCLDFVRIASRPDKITDALKYSLELTNRNYSVMLQLMDITNLKPEHYKILECWKYKNIFKTIYLADTYGIVQPENLDSYFLKFRSMGYDKISFHAHNKNQNALSNTLRAIALGAYSIDVSQTENGINGGNLLFAELKKHLSAII